MRFYLVFMLGEGDYWIEFWSPIFLIRIYLLFVFINKCWATRLYLSSRRVTAPLGPWIISWNGSWHGKNKFFLFLFWSRKSKCYLEISHNKEAYLLFSMGKTSGLSLILSTFLISKYDIKVFLIHDFSCFFLFITTPIESK